MNKAFISGNLTRDCEMRSTQGGTAILTFGVAVNDRKKDPRTGEWVDVPNFFDCVVFGRRAEALQKFLSKGIKVSIEGKLRWSQWEDKNGQKRSKVEIIVDEIELLSRRDGQQAPQAQQPSAYQQAVQNGPYNGSQGATDIYGDDIVF